MHVVFLSLVPFVLFFDARPRRPIDNNAGIFFLSEIAHIASIGQDFCSGLSGLAQNSFIAAAHDMAFIWARQLECCCVTAVYAGHGIVCGQPIPQGDGRTSQPAAVTPTSAAKTLRAENGASE